MSSRTLTELRVKGEMADQSLDQRVSVLGPEGTFVWAALPNLQMITRAAVEKRAYTLDIGRDGTYWWVGEYMRVLLGSSGHEMTLGMRALGSAVDTPDYSYHGPGGQPAPAPQSYGQISTVALCQHAPRKL